MARKGSAAQGAGKPKRRKKPLTAVAVEGFGKLVYDKPGSFWAGTCALPVLAGKFGRYLGGTAGERARLGWGGMPEGTFPVMVTDEKGTGPSAPQAEALRLLASKGAKVCREVLRCHAAARKAAKARWEDLSEGDDEAPAPRPQCGGVTVLDLHLGGVAYVEFDFLDDGIDEEHGSHVVYHPKAGTHWTSNAYETVTRTDNVYEEPEQTPGDRLALALIDGDRRKVERLLRQGADVNDLGQGAYPPLYYAVANANVELVRRLLELGADPNKRGGEKRSVLSEARETLRELRWTVKQGFVPRGLKTLHSHVERYEEIVGLLEGAGAR